MPKNNKWIIIFQPVNGLNAKKLSFEVTPNKMEKIIQMIEPEILKKKKATQTTSATLDQFFEEAN